MLMQLQMMKVQICGDEKGIQKHQIEYERYLIDNDHVLMDIMCRVH